ncbi:hypothetical protein [Paraburkholderia guartelaensis]|uniref:hypothetical protein n=1 Tax=Paraburkholderia guartelaensis TaxID=2546446 RepID=UPI002AB686F1|nr:hypothetical protein [Paraburkholderia guartelaensis]
MKRCGTPGEISGVVLILASDDAWYVTGQTLAGDGALVAAGLLEICLRFYCGVCCADGGRLMSSCDVPRGTWSCRGRETWEDRSVSVRSLMSLRP